MHRQLIYDMTLVELIARPTTQPAILDDLETFVTSGLGKGVVRAKDTPNFEANRIGIAGMLATMKEVESFGLTYDVVDDLTGKRLGRASSDTFRTADVVHALRRHNQKYGMVTMCVGMGQGAAGLFERV